MSILPPAKVLPITIGSIQYGDSQGFNCNVLRLLDARSGKEIKAVEIYRYPLDPNLETDVQTVFFKSMTLSGDGKDLLIENTRGHRFLFNLETQTAREINHPCTLTLIGCERIGPKWKVLVELTTANLHPSGNFYLDRISFGDSSRLENNLFEVKSPTEELPYRGMMAKRAAPEWISLGAVKKEQPTPPGFILLKPGQSHRVIVNLGEDYAFPEKGGRFTIRYRHHNHFSPNDVDLFSNEISVVLDPAAAGTSPIKIPVPE